MDILMSLRNDSTAVIFPPFDFFGSYPSSPFCITDAGDLQEWACLYRMDSDVNVLLATDQDHPTSTRDEAVTIDAEPRQELAEASTEVIIPSPTGEQTRDFSGSADESSLDSQNARSFKLVFRTENGTIDAQMNPTIQQGRLVDVPYIASALVEVMNEDDAAHESDKLSPAASVCQALGDHVKDKAATEIDGQDKSNVEVSQPSVGQTQSTGSQEVGSCETSLEEGSGSSLIAGPVTSQQKRSTVGDPSDETTDTRECAGNPSTVVDRSQESAYQASEAAGSSKGQNQEISMFRLALLAAVQAMGSIVGDFGLTDSQAIEKLQSLDLLELPKCPVPQGAVEKEVQGKQVTLPRRTLEIIDLTSDDQNGWVELASRRSPSTPRKRRGSFDIAGHSSTKKSRRSPRQSPRRLGNGILINERSPYVVDETNHPVSRYLEDD